jgi:putative salt-induced outer membrane protein YdiY
MNMRGLIAAAVTLSAAFASGDEVLFKSGDRLTGTVEKLEGGKMVFTSKVAGKVTLNVADIKTFSTDAPIEIKLADGSLVQQKALAAGEGEIALPADGAAQPKPLPLASIDQINPEKPRWKGAVVAGATFARGNTKSDNANVSFDATRRGENDRITLGGGYIFASQRDNSTGDKSTSADEWFLGGKYDYFFTEKFYGYGNVKYEKDRISDLDRRISPGVGVGYQWVERKDLSFFTEGGGSYIYEKYTDPDETRTYMAARLAYQLEMAFNDYVSAFHNLEYLPSLERADTFLVNTDVGLRAKMTERLILEAKSQLAYNSKPAEDREKKDFRHLLGVGWTF